ncbi:hypothetical protein M406DRAFT_263066 [Cryphonectria parasitica EP155]|uniref:Zn(2)-C6 fungal-type domain-containing protein n=1 Tax=Cryphonectria parasitica (strain ATCC 38755 / EP155) TaxID=660469 RepID=A0A9P4XYU9_CRYP1|nr:uncharacterized protein M406DRAFT_263066 [Cryphonectria parasitica EP155]KAF3763839.1 hypothetical protein M406DRAFT_263066 [Cryphonectria parasitica EP155]
MSIVLETKACESCAKSKRKCGKEKPRCHRCASRNLECSYPLARPGSFVLLQEDSPSTCESQTTTSPAALRNHTSDEISSPTLLGTPDLWDPSGLSEPQNVPPYSNAVLKRFHKTIQANLADWVYKGATNFIHKQLYMFRRPRCVQDAQGSLALYLARTDETEDAVFRTLDDRADQLLTDEGKHNTTSSLDTFGHLSRIHSLLTYQIIGLLDGDIHLRAKAEKRIDTLEAWIQQMMESLRFASSLLSGSGGNNTYAIINVLGLEEIVWQAWIFTESLRRTWVTVEGLHATYNALRRGWASCSAGMLLTARQGLWDAGSRYAWAEIVTGKDLWVMDGRHTEILFSLAMPDEVDGFTKMCMEISYGQERMKNWEAGVVC